jgi:hypothetical protein
MKTSHLARHLGGDPTTQEKHMSMTAEVDPFASADKSPAISFKDKPVGTVITVVVTDTPKKIQGKEYSKDTPAVWHNKDGSTSPKYSAVINGEIDGEPVSIWATIPSDLFAKLKAAQQELGRSVQPGDTVAIKFTGEEPGKGNPKKIYAVRITPGTPPPSSGDPFDDSTAAPAGKPDDGKFPDEVPW